MTKRRKTKTANHQNNDGCMHDGPVFIPLLIRNSQLCIVEKNEKNDISAVAIDSENDRDCLKSEVRLLQAENADIKKQVDKLEQAIANLKKQIEAAKSVESNSSGQTAEKQAERKSVTSSEKNSRRRTANEVSRRILEELSSCGNQGQISFITLGSYMKELGGTAKPIKWRVLEKKGKTMLLLSDKVLDVRQYHSKNAAITWEECDLRTWLNVDFVKKAFRMEEEFLLKYTEIENQDNKSNSIRGGKNTKDRVFLLSQSEYYKYFPNKIFAKAEATALAKSKQLSCRPGTAYGYWWLRSPGNGVVKAAQVNPDGNVITYGGNVTEKNIGVRPALWLELK